MADPRVRRIRQVGSIALGTVLLLAGIGSAPASGLSLPPPRLATVELIDKGRVNEIALATVDPVGGQRQQVLRSLFEEPGEGVAIAPFTSPAWTVNGDTLAFTGLSEGRPKEAIYVVEPTGKGLRRLPGAARGFNPVFSSDGRTLAFARAKIRPGKKRSQIFSSTATWVVDLAGGKPRRLTPLRNGLEHIPGSFAPDGSGLMLTKRDGRLDRPRVVFMPFDGGKSREVVRLGEDPAFSPDGSQIAFVGYLDLDIVVAEEEQEYPASELYVLNLDGSQPRRLTDTEDILESSPSWDPSGLRIAYVEAKGDTSFAPALALLFPKGNALMQINPDGTCRRQIASQRKVAFYGVAWQPGAPAGPVGC